MIANDFLDGMRDCDAGKEARLNASKDYYRGYAAQYEHEQIQTYITEKQDETLRNIRRI